ncbi:MAG: DUF3320 domain-containing protein [Lachnospiraceae bacterium]|nr:DUF3320 domain-containing protein [Lachnospiraceae bacterium]
MSEDTSRITENPVSIACDMTEVINYSLLCAGVPVIRSIEIRNSGESMLEHLTLRISATGDILNPTEKEIDFIAPASSVTITDLKPDFNTAAFAEITEKSILNLTFSLIYEDSEICSLSKEITLLAFDEWCGSGIFPELLSSFCIPNHPAINQVLSRASVLLEKWTSDPSFDAYQTNDPDRVLKQAASVYTALVEQNIVYCVSPASFEAQGQRVRLADTVFEQKMGNCLDLSLCYCSCLEAIGLHPFIVLTNDHSFAGVWLEDMTFPESIQYDPSAISKRMANGINELTVVEATAFTAGHAESFEEAVAIATRHLSTPEKIEYIIDIRRARMSGITPLPLRIKTENGYEIVRETLKPVNHAAPASISVADIQINNEETVFSRKTLWERKLLDIGLRNQLINLRMSKTLLPILCSSLEVLEDTLSDGCEFIVGPRPSDFQISEADINFDKIHELFPNKELLDSEFKSKRLRTTMTDTMLDKTMKELYRSSKSSLEENGANTLYMALGLLRWYENEKSVKPRYAPLVLIPIEMVRKSAGSGYTIRLRDDEPQMNITILEKLKQDFKIIINGLDPLPTDEHGIDLKTVFTIIRRSIMGLSKWDVLESAYLGIFTFSQFVMWNDIRNRSADLERNKVVKSLVEQRLAWDAEAMEIPEKVDEDSILLPLSADASQAFAIKEAARGRSFVLHGPPGTGKSQTITALIANALAAGKTVLFVAEKMAALSVVEKRLAKLGIGDFCLEVHSNKSRKRDVLDQLEAACNITKGHSPEEFAKNAEKASKLRKELDSYGKALHKKQSYGLSAYDLINIYEANIDAPDAIKLDTGLLAKLDESGLEACNETVNNLIAAGKAMGSPFGHPLARIKTPQYDHSLDDRLLSAADSYLRTLSAVSPAEGELASALSLSTPVEYSKHKELYETAKSLRAWLNYPAEWAASDNYNVFFKELLALCDSFIAQHAEHDKIAEKWNESFFTVDPGSMLNRYREAQGAFLFMKSIKTNSIVKELTSCSKSGVDKETLVAELTALLNYKSLENSNSRSLLSFTAALSGIPHNSAADWSSIRAMAANAYASLDRLTAINPDPAFRKSFCGKSTHAAAINNLCGSWESNEAARRGLYSVMCVDAAYPETRPDNFIAEEITLCNNIKANTDTLKDICLWNHFAAEADKLGISPVAEAYAGGLAEDMVAPAYYKALSNSLISSIADNDEYLKTFSDAMFNDKIRQFKEIDAKVMELTKKEIYSKLAANVPNFQASSAQSSETGILQRAIKSNGRGTSIRKLFSQIPNLLPRLTPCMLMSPLSAAQYLDPGTELFDLVVFDEASQLPTAKAVGAIARGKEAIIVGDPNQMPPTSFFMSDSTDEDNLDTEDLESILDDCLAIELPQTHLLWHYRSRHESLIAFSNSEFYENRLYTFPSVNDRESKVSFVAVDGYFDRGKTRQNLAEAQAIVEEIKKRCYNEDINSLSIGVVTFNISQSNLIDDLITDACREDPHLEDWLYNQDEPLFIKNLENVQGDERDVILFSVGYGTDKEGKVYMNFGPLNRDGGWRRLNVAVSRARHEMVIFSSLTSEQINLAKTGSQGVAALKAFLEYAEKGVLRNNINNANAKKPDSAGTVTAICKALNEKGYKTETNIGHSAYRIDIGIIDPEDPSKYLLGILLDGPVYASAQTTRDRELAQISVLEGLGWNIARIWSIGWWDNQKRELDSILKQLEEIKTAGHKLTVKGANAVKPAAEPTAAKKTDATAKADSIEAPAAGLPEENTSEQAPVNNIINSKPASPQADNGIQRVFRAAKLNPAPVSADVLLTADGKKEIKRRMEAVIEAEAPLNKEVLFKRILTSFGIQRANAKLQEQFAKVLDSLKLEITEQADTEFVWGKNASSTDIAFFRTSEAVSPDRRDVKDIPIQEIEQAVLYVIDCQIGLTREDLIRESAKLFGFTRTGEAINNYMSAGIQLALIDELIKFDANGRISRNKNC